MPGSKHSRSSKTIVGALVVTACLLAAGCHRSTATSEDTDSDECLPAGSVEAFQTFSSSDGSETYLLVVTESPDNRCPIGALVCMLAVGDKCFVQHYINEDGQPVYTLTPEEFDSLEEGSPTGWVYGDPPSGEVCIFPMNPDMPCPNLGYLDKTISN